jgi:hypothetical protein
MVIIDDPAIREYFRRGQRNLAADRKNSFLGRKVDKAGESRLRRQMARAGFAEFQVPEAQQPSLFLSTRDYLRTPYHSHIRLAEQTLGSVAVRKQIIPAGELFNADAVQKDPKRELNDWMKLRALDEPYEALFLYEGDRVWMMDSPSEAMTNDPAARKAHGRVLTFGLGIGYFTYMALLNPRVESVTVIESSPQVIDLFRELLYPCFPHDKAVMIRRQRAEECFTRDFLEPYDFIFVDIWQSPRDGLPILSSLLERYLPPLEKTAFWIEDSLMETVWTVNFLVLRQLACGIPAEVSPEYQWLKDKCLRHALSRPEPIRTVAALKEYIYGRDTLRRILGEPRTGGSDPARSAAGD